MTAEKPQGLFSRLHRQPVPGRNTSETFLTEIVRSVLAADERLMREAFRRLWGIEFPEGERLTAHTEVRYPACEGVPQESYIDLEVRSPSVTVWVECKVGARLNRYRFEAGEDVKDVDQVDKYSLVLDWVSGRADESTRRHCLVVLARDAIEPRRGRWFCGSKSWQDLYAVMAAHRLSLGVGVCHERSVWLLDEALAFFRENSLAPSEPLRRTDSDELPEKAVRIIAASLQGLTQPRVIEARRMQDGWTFRFDDSDDYFEVYFSDEGRFQAARIASGLLDVDLPTEFWTTTAEEQIEVLQGTIGRLQVAQVRKGKLTLAQNLDRFSLERRRIEHLVGLLPEAWRRGATFGDAQATAPEIRVVLKWPSGGQVVLAIAPTQKGVKPLLNVFDDDEGRRRLAAALALANIKALSEGRKSSVQVELSSTTLSDEQVPRLVGVLVGLYADTIA